ncbi:bifunctional UDP-N-acetylglucosamine diphosphorylase/glucosamine-1-phosphate N-acetyltransferase GlmU [Texcoconibacillus texcoconensis]|uniref:Bifunctional protein GlmU n=1 Tax=Texcoconibacillus texcoconensis TaxID=1095777 RepID=A0A840QUE0_9BACI|nr:bifunctional UDP-N-acetylglucosamine diphosphorylase/glucosamine-1-phosphate N-acetyltransferase GlmU [Texcoconibacillus texcoconensis]MBB5174908.1 bifunctional UDP-N-acetylglucosamine pyrophosphorylase/glucosamine-1-phosphate N-acetyltransferase [Texcoconibacillus texcoconensis]
MNNRFAVVLAAGKGTRMKSDLYKVLHPVCGKPMVQHTMDQLKQLNVQRIVTVVGHGAETVQEQIGDVTEYCVQSEQLGTGHAVMQADERLSEEKGTTLVLCGDTPLITSETMENLILHHESVGAKATILTAEVSDPTGYGRLVRNEEGFVEKIVEHKDASIEERKITEINTGTYCFDNEFLFSALKRIDNDNVQGEYYLPDVIEILKRECEKISAYATNDPEETMGINDRVALSEAESALRKRINRHWMREGVTIVDPPNTYIGPDVSIQPDTKILPGTMIEGNTTILSHCEIGPYSELKDSYIGEYTKVQHSVVHDSQVGQEVMIGPYAHIRPQSDIGSNVKIGNFVEVKKATFGDNSKASHLSYIGDADIGSDVNLGCGSITVNYDGENKHLTTIEDGAFIGCNANLIAPVTVGEKAYVAAGSTVTDDVPEQSLAIARQRQTTKDGYLKDDRK